MGGVLTLPFSDTPIELGQGSVQTNETDESSEDRPNFTDQINVFYLLPEEERFPIELPSELPDISVMAIDVQNFNHSSVNPPLLNSDDLSQLDTEEFTFGAGRVGMGVALLEFSEDGRLSKILWVHGEKELDDSDSDSDGVPDA